MELLQFDLKEDNVQIYYVWNKEIKTVDELVKLPPKIWKRVYISDYETPQGLRLRGHRNVWIILSQRDTLQTPSVIVGGF